MLSWLAVTASVKPALGYEKILIAKYNLVLIHFFKFTRAKKATAQIKNKYKILIWRLKNKSNLLYKIYDWQSRILKIIPEQNGWRPLLCSSWLFWMIVKNNIQHDATLHMKAGHITTTTFFIINKFIFEKVKKIYDELWK